MDVINFLKRKVKKKKKVPYDKVEQLCLQINNCKTSRGDTKYKFIDLATKLEFS